MFDDASSAILRNARLTARRIETEEAHWLVYELPASTLDRRSAPTLVFESEYLMRRLRNYPSDWRELPDDELLAVSWSV